MNIAVPIKPPSIEIRRIAERHGFMTFPHFLDNGYIFEGKPNLKWLKQNLRRYGYGLIQYAVAPDAMIEEAQKLKNQWPDINWIYPLHSRDEDITPFDWVGFPHAEERRDYDLKTFLSLTKNKKKWYLGFWDEAKPENVLVFDGFDTMIPYFHATKLGSAWHGWKKNREVGFLKMTNNELFELNLLNFKLAMKELVFNKAQTSTLSQFLTKGEDVESVQG